MNKVPDEAIFLFPGKTGDNIFRIPATIASSVYLEGLFGTKRFCYVFNKESMNLFSLLKLLKKGFHGHHDFYTTFGGEFDIKDFGCGGRVVPGYIDNLNTGQNSLIFNFEYRSFPTKALWEPHFEIAGELLGVAPTELLEPYLAADRAMYGDFTKKVTKEATKIVIDTTSSRIAANTLTERVFYELLISLSKKKLNQYEIIVNSGSAIKFLISLGWENISYRQIPFESSELDNAIILTGYSAMSCLASIRYIPNISIVDNAGLPHFLTKKRFSEADNYYFSYETPDITKKFIELIKYD